MNAGDLSFQRYQVILSPLPSPLSPLPSPLLSSLLSPPSLSSLLSFFYPRHIYVMNDYFAQLAHRLHMDEVIIKPDQYSLPPPTSSHSCLGIISSSFILSFYSLLLLFSFILHSSSYVVHSGDIFESITCAIYLDSGVVDPLWKGNDQRFLLFFFLLVSSFFLFVCFSFFLND